MSDSWDDIPSEFHTATGSNADFDVYNTTTYEEILILYGYVKIVADATVATRTVGLRVREESSSLDPLLSGAVSATASQTKEAHWYPGIENHTPTNGNEIFPMPVQTIVPAGGKVIARVGSGQAGDAITAILCIKRRRYAFT